MSLRNIKYGFKVIKVLEAVAKTVMKTTLLWGCPGKDPMEDLFTYLKRLDPSTSDANSVLEDKKSHPKFNKTQKEKVENDSSCDTFDITLLFICIKLCCMNMARLNDSPWFSDGDELENLLYLIKKARNNAMHESLEITETEFKDKTKKLREDLIATLTKAKERFSRSDEELKKEIENIELNMNRITDEPLDLDDILSDHNSVLQEHIISREADKLKKHPIYNEKHLSPLSFLTTSKVRLEIDNIYTEIKFMEGRLQGKGRIVEHLDLIKQVQGQSNKPQVLVVEGLAGSGKTTLAAHMTKKWLESSNDSISGLSKYKLLLKVRCRDSHLSTYDKLVDDLLKPSTPEYKDLLLKLVKKSSLLVIIDGIDEVNKYSQELIREMLDEMQGNPECTVMLTTRPEALQEGLELIPDTYYRVEVELVGIPTGQREKFLRRYLVELPKACHSATPPTTDDINQCIKQLDVKSKEHFRLPLNLSIVAILMYSWPQKMNRNTTQTDVYNHLHELILEKLNNRLIKNDLTKHFDRDTRLDMVEKYLSTMYQEMFVALTHDQLTLEEESANKLREECKTLGLPRKEMMPAFMTTRSKEGLGKVELDCYSVLHKGFQERYGALYIMQSIKKLKKPDETDNVINIMKTTPGAGPIQLHKMQNLIMILLGMIPCDWNSIIVKEVVNLLQEAGVNRRDQWLDVIEDTKCREEVVKVIADHFPLTRAGAGPRSGDAGPIVIQDGRIEAYGKLLSHLPRRYVELDIAGDPASLNHLLGPLDRHVCIEFNLWQTYHHPTADIPPIVDQLLRTVQLSPHLRTYRGQLSDYVLSRLQQLLSLRHIYLGISSNHQATLLMKLITSTSCKHLEDLTVVVTSDVLPAAITTNLPVTKLGVDLYLLDVTDVRMSWACEMVANLINPSQRVYYIRFPRSTLDEAGWIRLIQDLGQRGIENVSLMVVPETSISSEQEDQIRPICRSTLGAGLIRDDFNWFKK